MTTAEMTPATARIAKAAPRPIGFARTLSSEWSKLISLRSTQLTLGLGLLLSFTTTALVVVAMGSTQTEWPDDFDPATISMVGNIFSLIVFSAFGVMAVSREYSNGLIRLTLIATPNRRRVFLAKLVIVTTTTLILGLVTTLGMFYLGQALMGAYDMPTASLSDPDTQRMVIGLGLVMPFFPMMGMALGFIMRSTAGGITTILALLWLPQIFGEFVPAWWQNHILSMLPSNGVDSLTIAQLHPSAAFSGPVFATAVVAGWLLAVVGGAYIAFARRDA